MFLANMSHEIRTPMNAVLGFAQLLERDPSLSPLARNKVATIMKSGEHLLSIINDILEMSRIEAGRVEIRTEPIDLAALLNDLAVMFRLRAEEKGLAFTLESLADLPRYIVVDLGKLRQILINLLGNAVKFTHKGTITMRAMPAGIDRIAIEVQDTGIGITAEEQEKLFRPFERTRSGEQAAGGTGLGLAISREYAHLMGGELTVFSAADNGSCFRFECPVQICKEIPSSVVPPQRVIGLASGQEELRVLVVDDLDANRELLRVMLEPLGFIVDEAANGQEAVDKAQSLLPRIILMDLVMPGMDGEETTRIIRSSSLQEPPVIIGISASAFDTQKQQFLDSGINAFIAKPFREQELFEVLARHAGVLFETGEDEAVTGIPPRQPLPTLDKMSAEWNEMFIEALARKNITRIRKLGEEARESDPVLSAWLLERAGMYDLEGIKQLVDDRRLEKMP
jgi:CheY-like chemotaxis protein/anti-sigma regulatory factor (Ser/Thr protein kinase)